jgi:divalent metal cation (Fe/Co/Zn/Cd) transporter
LPLPLVERSEKEMAQIIRKRVEGMKNVRGCHQMNVHMTGKRLEVNMHVTLDSNLRLEEAHKIASDVEREIKSIVPNARVTIHTEPLGNSQKEIWRLVKEIAETVPGSRGTHNIHIQKIDGALCVDLHLEVGANMTVIQAHELSDEVERKLRAANPKISEITIHIESASDLISMEQIGAGTELESYIEHVVKRFPEIKTFHKPTIRKIGNRLHIVLQCHFDPNIDIVKAHGISTKLETIIKSEYPNIERIDVHEEPA